MNSFTTDEGIRRASPEHKPHHGTRQEIKKTFSKKTTPHNLYTHTCASSSRLSVINFSIGLNPTPVVLAAFSLSRSLALASGRIPSLVRHQGPQHTNTLGDPFLLDIAHYDLDRLVRFGPFVNEGLWTGADDMKVYRCGSEARRRSLGCGRGRRMWALRL